MTRFVYLLTFTPSLLISTGLNRLNECAHCCSKVVMNGSMSGTVSKVSGIDEPLDYFFLSF
jgi:hypothetical protein